MSNSEISLDTDKLVTTEKAAELLSIPAATLTKWRSTGQVKIPFVRIGRQIKYRTTDLKCFIESSTIR
ncbi:helix-turn-helix domain-containing protein [Methylovulum miyakonense]|uniref:helix-turn-helix domain-containing protein n=1 Tax=Methylovulum miyakonense TaxID=645578 RepID=UPI000A06E63D|nr:helix-turn-helix domain-containing protein [Methylovulum miyakonense]